METVERYNELAHAGKDADFSKVSTRLFPVENPPYYAVPFGDSGMLVLIGGIDCDVDCRALDAEKNPVPGLFVAGNTMGGRFLVDYPVTVAGASHSMAMSFGRLAGRKAAEGLRRASRAPQGAGRRCRPAPSRGCAARGLLYRTAQGRSPPSPSGLGLARRYCGSAA